MPSVTVTVDPLLNETLRVAPSVIILALFIVTLQFENSKREERSIYPPPTESFITIVEFVTALELWLYIEFPIKSRV